MDLHFLMKQNENMKLQHIQKNLKTKDGKNKMKKMKN